MVEWASSSGQLVGRRRRWLGALQLSEEDLPVSDDAATTALLGAVRANGLRILPLPPAFLQLRARLDFLRSGDDVSRLDARDDRAQQKSAVRGRGPRKPRRPKRAPVETGGLAAHRKEGEEGVLLDGVGGARDAGTGTAGEGPPWVPESLVTVCEGPASGLPRGAGMCVELPDLSDVQLLDRLDRWLGPFLGSVRTKEDLRGLNWEAIIGGLLSQEQVRYVEKAAPLNWSAPWGTAEIEYRGGSATSTVALDEVLRTVRNPPVLPQGLRGRVRLLVAGPDRAVVAEVPDLSTFWEVHYPKLRSELSRKYCALSWPPVT